MTSQREKLTQALRDEFARGTESAPLDSFAAGVAAALSRRGITGPVPGANPSAEKPWNRTVIDTLLADKQAAEEAAARKRAEQSAPPPPVTIAEQVRRALKVQVEKLNEPVEPPEDDNGSYLPLNGAGLLKRALGGQPGTVNGGSW